MDILIKLLPCYTVQCGCVSASTLHVVATVIRTCFLDFIYNPYNYDPKNLLVSTLFYLLPANHVYDVILCRM